MAIGRLAWVILAGVLVACTTSTSAPTAKPGASAPHPTAAAAAHSATAIPARASAADAVHVLSRLTFGPRQRDVERVRTVGIAAYIEEQLHPERIDDREVDARLRDLPSLAMSIPDLLRAYPRPDAATREMIRDGGATARREMMERYPPEKRPNRIAAELAAAKMLRAVASERQLQEVMVDFWFNHFNVYALKGDVRWYVGTYERDVIRPLALGRVRDLVRATARHPAMLFYLDNWLSARPDLVIPAGPNRGRRAGLNENYARELMELHTLGVDGGYTQADVREVARAFTGWTIDRPQTEGRFVYRPLMHDTGRKVVLGWPLEGGGGEQDGERVIDLVTRHEATARHLATKLARRFVADDPPPALVERVAATYRETDGDVRAMLRTIFGAPEFWAVEARRAKIKKPLELVASSVRALGGTVDTRGVFALGTAVGRIGERLYEAEPPTGHPDRAEPWVNPGTLLARMNFALTLARNRLDGVAVDLAAIAAEDRRHPEAVLDRLLALLLHGEATPATRAVLAAQLKDPQITRKTTDDRGPANTDVETLAALVLGSPEFQRR